MITSEHYRKIKLLEEQAALLGFRVGFSKYRELTLLAAGSYADLNATLPTFSRDAEFGYGTVEELLSYLSGWQQALVYTSSLGLTSATKIKAKEEHWNKHYKNQEEVKQQEATLKLLKDR